MLRDLSFWVAVSQLILVLMGVWIALHEDWAKRHRFLVLAGFVIAGFAGLYMTRQQSRQSGQEVAEAQRQAADANTKLSNTLEKINNQSIQIGNQTGEISRVQNLNTALQNKLLDQNGQLIDSSKQIAELSKESIASATGGNSFCYMRFSDQYVRNALTPDFWHQGKQPLYDVHVRIFDVEKSITTNVEIGNLPANSVYVPPSLPRFVLSDLTRQYAFNIFYDGRNGHWMEKLLLRWVGDHWSHAMQVSKETVVSKSWPKPGKVILTKIDKDFPTRTPDWNVGMGHWQKVVPP